MSAGKTFEEWYLRELEYEGFNSMEESARRAWLASRKAVEAELAAAMRAVLATLRGIEEAAHRPDPLSEALNSGDGSYRP